MPAWEPVRFHAACAPAGATQAPRMLPGVYVGHARARLTHAFSSTTMYVRSNAGCATTTPRPALRSFVLITCRVMRIRGLTRAAPLQAETQGPWFLLPRGSVTLGSDASSHLE